MGEEDVQEWKDQCVGDIVIVNHDNNRPDFGLREDILYTIKTIRVYDGGRDVNIQLERDDGILTWVYPDNVKVGFTGLCGTCKNGCRSDDTETCAFYQHMRETTQ